MQAFILTLSTGLPVRRWLRSCAFYWESSSLVVHMNCFETRCWVLMSTPGCPLAFHLFAGWDRFLSHLLPHLCLHIEFCWSESIFVAPVIILESECRYGVLTCCSITYYQCLAGKLMNFTYLVAIVYYCYLLSFIWIFSRFHCTTRLCSHANVIGFRVLLSCTCIQVDNTFGMRSDGFLFVEEGTMSCLFVIDYVMQLLIVERFCCFARDDNGRYVRGGNGCVLEVVMDAFTGGNGGRVLEVVMDASTD